MSFPLPRRQFPQAADTFTAACTVSASDVADGDMAGEFIEIVLGYAGGPSRFHQADIADGKPSIDIRFLGAVAAGGWDWTDQEPSAFAQILKGELPVAGGT